MSERYKRHPNTKCCVCNKPIYRRPIEIQRNESKVYCGIKCYGIACRKEKPCVVCGKLMLAGLNKKTCSRACANKHREGIKYKLGRPRDKVVHYRSIKVRLLDLRGKVCERCGYDIFEILQVHHKDRNRENNDLGNLELICPNCHYREHLLEKSWLKRRVGRTVMRES